MKDLFKALRNIENKNRESHRTTFSIRPGAIFSSNFWDPTIPGAPRAVIWYVIPRPEWMDVLILYDAGMPRPLSLGYQDLCQDE